MVTQPGSARTVAARFVARPNRFVVRARLTDGSVVEAHLADPGRLVELLRPNAELRLRPAPDDVTRRTTHTVCLVRAAAGTGPWVSVEAGRANHLAAPLLAGGAIRGIPRGSGLRREVRHGSSRFDFAVDTARGGPVLVEVKSVTLVENGVARFPDAPTSRGTRHVRELTEITSSGGRAAVLFVVQRHDARRVEPHAGIDPAFVAALAEARGAGVVLRAARFRMRADGSAVHIGAVPVRVPR